MSFQLTHKHGVRRLALLGTGLCLAAALPLAGAQTPPPPAKPPQVQTVPARPDPQFQQAVQQQQLRDQLQKTQLQGQLRQNVSQVAGTPYLPATLPRQQLDQADRAQQDRERAKQQDLLNSQRDALALPPAPPKTLPKRDHDDD
ncbi:MAG: hypothetical protein ACTS5I_07005 [Rhodanobacter sp.]